jgi:hypothetical protein
MSVTIKKHSKQVDKERSYLGVVEVGPFQIDKHRKNERGGSQSDAQSAEMRPDSVVPVRPLRIALRDVRAAPWNEPSIFV